MTKHDCFPDLNKLVWSSLRTLNHMSLICILIKEETLKIFQEGRNWPLGGDAHNETYF